MTNEINYNKLLEVGQIFKNYNALCEYLDEEVKTSNSKKAQEKNWERHFSLEKKISRYELKITEIHEDIKDKVDNRKGGNNTVNYIDKIEESILRMLSRRDDSESVFLSKNKLLKALNVVNDNYVDSKYKQAKLSSITEISKDEISDFYQASDSLLYRNVESALKRLRSKALLVFESVVTVGYVETYAITNSDGDVKAVKKVITDKYGDQTLDISASEAVSHIDYRRATKDEKDIILATEHATLQKYRYDTPRDAFLAGKFSEFYEEISEYLFEEHNIYMYFNSYEITFNKENVLDALEKLKGTNNESGDTTQEYLNKEIMERMTLNAKNRNESSRMNSLRSLEITISSDKRHFACMGKS